MFYIWNGFWKWIILVKPAFWSWQSELIFINLLWPHTSHFKPTSLQGNIRRFIILDIWNRKKHMHKLCYLLVASLNIYKSTGDWTIKIFKVFDISHMTPFEQSTKVDSFAFKVCKKLVTRNLLQKKVKWINISY